MEIPAYIQKMFESQWALAKSCYQSLPDSAKDLCTEDQYCTNFVGLFPPVVTTWTASQ